MTNSMVIFERASQMLAEADTIQKAKELKNLALTAADWARRRGMGEEAIQYCRSYALEAERKVGEMIIAGKVNGAVRARGRRPKTTHGEVLEITDIGLTHKESAEAQMLAKVPRETFEAVKNGKRTKAQVKREVREKEREKKKRLARERLIRLKPVVTDRFLLCQSDIWDAHKKVEPESVDWIITDPPYGFEHTNVYEGLAAFSVYALKNGGSLVCMIGQSYLPEIVRLLNKGLTYHWTLAYLTPGGQAVQLWDRKVNTFWKPLLWFVKGKYSGDWVGDVCRSDANDKRHHHWGQSESGIADIIGRFTKPGQMICDPFCGGGTTGVVAIDMHREFIGMDEDELALEKTRKRLCMK